jgi:hypothetical protein
MSNSLDTPATNFQNTEKFRGCLSKWDNFLYLPLLFAMYQVIWTPLCLIFEIKSTIFPKLSLQGELYCIYHFSTTLHLGKTGMDRRILVIVYTDLSI